MKAINKHTGAEREFTDAHWNVLPGGNKNDWEIVNEFPTKKTAATYTPPELVSKEAANVEVDKTKTPTEEEILHAKIISLKKEKSDLTNAQIAKELGTHHNIVKSVLAKADKK